MTPTVRIGVDCRALIDERVSGVSVYTEAIIQELKMNPEVELELFYQNGHRADHLHAKYPQIKWVKKSSTWFHLQCLLWQPRADFDFDVIWMPDRRPFYKTSTPVVMTIHDMVPKRVPASLSKKARLWHWLFNTKKLLKNVDGVLCPSFSVEQEIPRDIMRCVSYEGSNLEGAGKPTKGLKDYSLLIAPADPRKRFNWVLRLAKEFPKDQFVWAGEKRNDDRFRKKKNKLPRNLVRLFEISEEEKTWLIRNARLLFALSEYEGFDLPALEAVSVKTPVILSDISVHQELYKDTNFINTYDELRTEYLRSREIKLKVPTPRGKYSWEAAAERTLFFLRRVVQDKNR